jgi:hypothetical protein
MLLSAYVDFGIPPHIYKRFLAKSKCLSAANCERTISALRPAGTGLWRDGRTTDSVCYG